MRRPVAIGSGDESRAFSLRDRLGDESSFRPVAGSLPSEDLVYRIVSPQVDGTQGRFVALERPPLPPVRGRGGNARVPLCSVKAPRMTMVRFPVRHRLDAGGDGGGELVLGPGEFRAGGRDGPLVDAAGGSSRGPPTYRRSVGVRRGRDLRQAVGAGNLGFVDPLRPIVSGLAAAGRSSLGSGPSCDDRPVPRHRDRVCEGYNRKLWMRR